MSGRRGGIHSPPVALFALPPGPGAPPPLPPPPASRVVTFRPKEDM